MHYFVPSPFFMRWPPSYVKKLLSLRYSVLLLFIASFHLKCLYSFDTF